MHHACYIIRESSRSCYTSIIRFIKYESSLVHVTTFRRALVHVILCMMYVIIFERPIVHVITFSRAPVQVIALYYITFKRPLMYVIKFLSTLMHAILWIMHVIIIQESPRTCYIIHHLCYNIQGSSRPCYI